MPMKNLWDEIATLLDQRPIPINEIAVAISKAASIGRGEDFETVLKIARMDDVMDVYLVAPAMAFLPAWGEKGVKALISFGFDPSYKFKTQHRAIDVLLAISLGRCPQEHVTSFLPNNWNQIPKYTVSPELKSYCSKLLREQILISLADQERKQNLFWTLGQMGMFSGLEESDDEIFQHFLDITVDSHLVLNIDLIEQFEKLLDSGPEREEELQTFLTSHPILLDAFISTLYAKQELGSDFITDFVIRRMNDQYVLVEIENSTDPVFNKNGTFSSEVNTAISQVRDFQAWVSDNIAYAQKKLPNIKHPEGLVIIGRGKWLSDIEIKRLSEENFIRRGHIKIVTYDDLLDQAKIVHRNLLERPQVLRSKDGKGI
jgi:hypothetical protein